MEDARIEAQKDAHGWAYERKFASIDTMPNTKTVINMIYEQKKRGGKQ